MAFSTFKLLLKPKSFRSLTPPKVGFVRLPKVLGSKTKKKLKKFIFLKKPELLDIPKNGFGLPGWSTSKFSIPLLWYNSNKTKFAGVTSEY